MKTCGIICQCKSNYRWLPHTCIYCRQSGFHNRSTLAHKFTSTIHHQKISLPCYDVVFSWRVDAFLNFKTESDVGWDRHASRAKRNQARKCDGEKSVRKRKQNLVKSHQDSLCNYGKQAKSWTVRTFYFFLYQI